MTIYEILFVLGTGIPLGIFICWIVYLLDNRKPKRPKKIQVKFLKQEEVKIDFKQTLKPQSRFQKELAEAYSKRYEEAKKLGIDFAQMIERDWCGIPPPTGSVVVEPGAVNSPTRGTGCYMTRKEFWEDWGDPNVSIETIIERGKEGIPKKLATPQRIKKGAFISIAEAINASRKDGPPIPSAKDGEPLFPNDHGASWRNKVDLFSYLDDHTRSVLLREDPPDWELVWEEVGDKYRAVRLSADPDSPVYRLPIPEVRRRHYRTCLKALERAKKLRNPPLPEEIGIAWMKVHEKRVTDLKTEGTTIIQIWQTYEKLEEEDD